MSTEPASPSNSSAADTTGSTRVRERSRQDLAAKPKRSVNLDARRVLTSVLGIVAGLVRLITLVFAVILVAYVVFTFFQANPANPWAQFVGTWAHNVSLGLDNLFAPGDPRVAVLVNFGLAAIIWLVIGTVVSNILRRI